MLSLYEGDLVNSSKSIYTSQLGAGLGLVDETKLLLQLYQEGISANQLYEAALKSGLFPMISARRLRNVVIECFAPRYIKSNVAKHLKLLASGLSSSAVKQLFLIYTATANPILWDFIDEIYWERYSGGRDSITVDDARDFVINAVREGKTQKPWSDSTIKRQASYIVGCCADYGLLSAGRGSKRSIQPVRIEEAIVLYLAYKLHFEGLGDNAMINHKTWALFGLDASDVRDELKGLAKNGWLIVQSAGEVTRIGWQIKTMEDVIDVITQS